MRLKSKHIKFLGVLAPQYVRFFVFGLITSLVLAVPVSADCSVRHSHEGGAPHNGTQKSQSDGHSHQHGTSANQHYQAYSSSTYYNSCTCPFFDLSLTALLSPSTSDSSKTISQLSVTGPLTSIIGYSASFNDANIPHSGDGSPYVPTGHQTRLLLSSLHRDHLVRSCPPHR